MSDQVRHTLYRCGQIHQGITGTQPPAFQAADACKPAGRVGRTQALYCAPDLRGLARWYSAHMACRLDLGCRELSYRGPELYAYPVAAWDVACARFNNGHPDPFAGYWHTGVPLTELLACSDLKGDEWEVLAGPSCVTVRRAVSDRRIVMAACEHTARELEWKLWPRKMAKGNSLRAYPSYALS